MHEVIELAGTARASSGCARCEGIPEAPATAGELHLWFPLSHSLQKAVAWLREHDVPVQVDGGNLAITASVPTGRLGEVADGLDEAFSAEELPDIRALVTAPGVEPAPADFPRVTTLARIVGAHRGAWLLELPRDGRLTSHFQPIVQARDTSKVFAHEALMRGVSTDGAPPVFPSELIDAARRADLLFQLDLAARRTAIRCAHERSLATKLFINFTPTAIYDPAFCLRSTVAAVEASGLRREQVVFEVIESDRATDLTHLLNVLAYYRDQGFGVALDDFGAGYSSVNMLHQVRPDYVKLDMELIRDVDLDPYKATIARRVLDIAQELDVRTIVEGVEREGELEWAIEHGADYVQGYLIARPNAVPVTATPYFAFGPLSEAPPAPGQLSFEEPAATSLVR